MTQDEFGIFPKIYIVANSPKNPVCFIIMNSKYSLNFVCDSLKFQKFKKNKNNKFEFVWEAEAGWLQ